MVILFKSDKARKQLLGQGLVYTIRARRKREGFDVAKVSMYGRSLGRVLIEYVGEVDLNTLIVRGRNGYVWNLEDFVNESGFNSVTEWVEEAKKLNKIEGNRAYLYKVVLSGDK